MSMGECNCAVAWQPHAKSIIERIKFIFYRSVFGGDWISSLTDERHSTTVLILRRVVSTRFPDTMPSVGH